MASEFLIETLFGEFQWMNTKKKYDSHSNKYSSHSKWACVYVEYVLEPTSRSFQVIKYLQQLDFE